MEVKVPRDILKYEEALFFGLSLRQFLFSLMAVGIAVGAFLLANPVLGTETASWICMVAALPFALLGFVRYNGMTADQFLKVWIRSELLFPKVLVFRGDNFYMDAVEQGRSGEVNPRRKTKDGAVTGKPEKQKKERQQKEKDFERRGRNIYKFHRRGLVGK